MESRRDRKKRRTRREIFEAARALFAARDPDAVTIGEICRAADVARATFFLHYPTKAALLEELDRQLAAQLTGLLGEPRGSAAGELRLLFDALAERLRGSPALLGELLTAPDAAADDAAEPRLRDLVEETVRRGQQRGELRRNLSPRLAAALFLETTAAVLAGRVYRDGETGPEEIRSQLLQALLHGLSEPKPRLKWRPPTAALR